MGPVVWWWRWWLGMDPNRDRQLNDARELLDEQRSASEVISTRLEVRDGEVEQLRGRVQTLVGAQQDAEELRTQVAQLEQASTEAKALRARVSELEQASAEADRLRAELDQARAATAELTAQVAELETQRQEAVAAAAAPDTSATTTPDATATTPDASATTTPDVAKAKEILGASVKLDDLTLIDGVGPKIAGLLADAGIDTWRTLADADTERLEAVLAEAGPRYRMHDPSQWPDQAALLADGRWQEFKDLKEA